MKEEIWIPREKYYKLCEDIRNWLSGPSISRYSAKGLMTIRGKIISFLIVNPGLKLWIREMTALLTMADRFGIDYFDEETIDRSYVFDEMDNWLRLDNVSLSRKWYSQQIETVAIHKLKELVISTDASNYQGGVHIEYGNKPGQIVEMPLFWAPNEANLDIACKEILAVKKVLELLRDVAGKYLVFKVDNTVVVNSFKNDGCRNLLVTRYHKEIMKLAFKMQCHIRVDWISTHLQMADAPSRNLLSHNDSRINFALRFAFIVSFPNGVDLFATLPNRVYHRYHSRYDEFQSETMFVFDTSFSVNDFLYAYPPSGLSFSCLHLLKRLPDCRQAMVIHEFGSNALLHLTARKQFHARLLVGTRNSPCCLTTGKKLQPNGSSSDFYRAHGEPLRTWIYFRHVSPYKIRQFHTLYMQQRHPMGLVVNNKFLRRVFRLWRIRAHRNRCAILREFAGNDLDAHCEKCSSDSPFCFQFENLTTHH